MPSVLDLWLGVVTVAILPAGTWAAKKVIAHDKAIAVQDEKLRQILEKVEDIRLFLKEQRPLV